MARRSRTMSFKGDLIAFSKKIGRNLDETHRGIVIKLFTAVIMDTPVDIGALRGGWFISQNKPDFNSYIRLDPSGAVASASVRSNPGKAGTRTYLTNAMPYVQVAEYGEWNGPTAKVTSSGYSRKAPAGMVRRNFARIQAVVRESVRESKRTG